MTDSAALTFGPSTTNDDLAAALLALLHRHGSQWSVIYYEALDEAITRLCELPAEDD